MFGLEPRTQTRTESAGTDEAPCVSAIGESAIGLNLKLQPQRLAWEILVPESPTPKNLAATQISYKETKIQTKTVDLETKPPL